MKASQNKYSLKQAHRWGFGEKFGGAVSVQATLCGGWMAPTCILNSYLQKKLGQERRGGGSLLETRLSGVRITLERATTAFLETTCSGISGKNRQ